MHKCLYMICPTDRMESVICSKYEGYKYFFTSLGNAQILDDETIGQIAALIEKHDIRQITFVLAEDNQIILDAIGNQSFFEVRGLRAFYDFIQEQKKNTLNSWQMYQQYPMLLSYHLNERIKHLQTKLRGMLPYPPQYNGKLYSKEYNSFRDIHSELVCFYPNNLN